MGCVELSRSRVKVIVETDGSPLAKAPPPGDDNRYIKEKGRKLLTFCSACARHTRHDASLNVEVTTWKHVSKLRRLSEQRQVVIWRDHDVCG
jgi:hypothetical protein